MDKETVRSNAKAKFYEDLHKLKNGDSISDREKVVKIEEAAKTITCFYCLDYRRVYKDREGMFSNLDQRGDYDIINCLPCNDNANWIQCSSGPTSQYPGIVKRGTRERAWFEKSAVEVGENMAKKVAEKIAIL